MVQKLLPNRAREQAEQNANFCNLALAGRLLVRLEGTIDAGLRRVLEL